jgi:hypothetical protein
MVRLNFCQFYNMINGEPYHDVPPPTKYNFASYADQITTSPISNVEGGGHQLRPLTDEDTARYAADDVTAHYLAMHAGESPCRLGDPLTDEEFRQFLGM